MPRYADPQACPDCRSALSPGSPRCPSCALSLTGPVPCELFATLTRADELLSVLRAASASPPPLSPPLSPPLLSPAHPTRARPLARLTGAAVPRILLGLGAACLLVAAAVFFVVAWDHLGLGGRTGVLATVTVLAGATAAWAVLRTLAAAAEALTVVTAGLVVLDLAGAARAGWLGHPSAAGLVALVGVVLLGLGGGAALAARRTARPHLYAAEVTAAVGLVAGSAGLAALLDAPAAVVQLAGLLAAGAVGAVALTVRLRVLGAVAGTLAAAWWLALLLDGLAGCLDHPTLRGLLVEARGWPVLTAAAVLALPTLSSRVPRPARLACGSGALALLAVLAAVPAVDEPLGVGTLVALAVLTLAGLGARVLPPRWGAVVLAPAALAALASLAVLAAQAEAVAARLDTDAVWSRPAGLALPAGPLVPGWPGLVVPTLIALGWTALALGRLAGRRPARPLILALAAPVVTLGGVATAASYAVPRWSLVALLAVASVTLAGWGLSRRGPAVALGTSVAGASSLAVVTLVVALPSAGLSLVALTVALTLAAATDLTGRPALRPVAQGALPVTLAALVLDAAGLAGLGPDPRVLLVVVAVGLLTLARPTGPVVAVGGPAVLVTVAVGARNLDWLALDLVAGGGLLLAAALLHRRPTLAWAGTALVLAGGWAHLAGAGVTTLDAYTLPPALVLLAVGIRRMHRHDTDSLPALTPGLALALAPTLVLALGDPVSVRAVLLGLACAVLVLIGAARRIAAPLLFGAGAGALLVLRQASSADVLPQWVGLAVVGLLLTVLGITWEQRLHDLRVAAGYLRALR